MVEEALVLKGNNNPDIPRKILACVEEALVLKGNNNDVLQNLCNGPVEEALVLKGNNNRNSSRNSSVLVEEALVLKGNNNKTICIGILEIQFLCIFLHLSVIRVWNFCGNSLSLHKLLPHKVATH